MLIINHFHIFSCLFRSISNLQTTELIYMEGEQVDFGEIIWANEVCPGKWFMSLLPNIDSAKANTCYRIQSVLSTRIWMKLNEIEWTHFESFSRKFII